MVDVRKKNVGATARIGVVLSSGGGRGVFAHTGFLAALEAMGIETVAVSGCSAGALVGGIYASGSNMHHWLEKIRNVHTREYWTPDSWLRLFWNLIIRKGRGYSGLSDTRAAIEFIQSNLKVRRFEECRVPFYSLSMNLSRSEKTLFSGGELAPRIMASAAMPLLYRPVEIDGDWYSDGATIELAPTEAICCKHDLDALIVHHTAVHREGADALTWALKQPWSLIGILYLLLYRERPWYLSGQPLTFHRCPGGCGAAVIVIEPDLPELSWPLNTGGSDIYTRAMEQTLTLLQPYLGHLKSDPRALPLMPPEYVQKEISCDNNDGHV